MLSNRANELMEKYPASNHGLMATAGCYTDLTFPEGQFTNFLTGYGYHVSTENMKDRIDRAISFNSCLAVAQAYEAMETFIKDVLSLVYIETWHKDKFKFKDVYFTVAEVRDNLFQIKEKRGFIKIIRRISPFFKDNEYNRFWKNISITDWYYLMEKVRHDIVHRRQVIGEDLEKAIVA